MSRDTHQLVRQAKAQGFVEATRNGHRILISPEGHRVILAQTPSDRRSVLNERARLRRLGLADRPQKATRAPEAPAAAHRVQRALRKTPEATAHQLAQRLNLSRPEVESALRWLKAHAPAS